MNSPLLSVIIPVYKVENYLQQCIDSVLGQTFADLEVILVDDGSPDACPALCDEYAERDSRVRVTHQHNFGLAGARNTGLGLAQGEYVAFLDSDDYLEPDAYAKLYAAAVKHDADIVFCQAKYFDDTTQEIIKANDASSLPLFNDKRFSEVFTWRDVGVEKIFSYDSFVVAWNKICRRSFLAELCADFPLGLIYEDNPFYFQTIFAANRLCAVRERLIIYRINRKGSIIQDVDDGKSARTMHILAILADIERRIQPLLPERLVSLFYRYALDEITYKYSLVPESFQEKYLSLAKGILPVGLYWKLHLRIWRKKLGECKTYLRFFIRISRDYHERSLCRFSLISVLSVEKRTELSGEVDGIVAMGMGGRTEVRAALDEGFPQDSVHFCPNYTLADLNGKFDAFITKPSIGPHKYRIDLHNRYISYRESSNTDTGLAEESTSVRGFFSILQHILFADCSSPPLAAEALKYLFYALNCIFPDKNIHFLTLGTYNSRDRSYLRLPKNLDILPSEDAAKLPGILCRRKTKSFSRYIVIKVLGLPVITVRRK